MIDHRRLGALPPSAVAMAGIPFDANSSFLRGPALAPPRIREALYCGSANRFSESCRHYRYG